MAILGKRRGRRDKNVRHAGTRVSSDQIARLRNGGSVPSARILMNGTVGRRISLKESNKTYRAEHDKLAKKVFLCIAVLIVLGFLSLGVMGAAGQYYPYSSPYHVYNPIEVARAIYEHAYNGLASVTHWYSPHGNTYLMENVPGYWAVAKRAGVVAITLICAILLSVAGMLYQNVFKNPIAGPGMLGVSSGVSLGMMLIVYIYGLSAQAMITQRYILCYGFGALILIFVIIAGRKLSGKGKPFDIVTMLLIGSILSQMLGFIVSYVTLFVMDEDVYAVYYTMSQMLTVDTSAISWICLGVASVVALVPIIARRYKFTALALDDADMRMLGLSPTGLRALALICGAIMMLAAQVHIGMVGLVSLIVPFLSRSLFGCEFNKQLIGNVCIGTILLLVCRDITDLIPFVADGLALGSVVSVVAMPLFAVIMARQMRGWS